MTTCLRIAVLTGCNKQLFIDAGIRNLSSTEFVNFIYFVKKEIVKCGICQVRKFKIKNSENVNVGIDLLSSEIVKKIKNTLLVI